MFWLLAANRICVAASRTWPMLPGADCIFSEKIGLNRVDDQERGLQADQLLEHALEAGLGEQIQRRTADAEPLAARLDLMLRFLAGAVEHGPRLARDVRRPPAAAAWTCRCRARRRAAPAIRARRRRRAHDRARRCPSTCGPRCRRPHPRTAARRRRQARACRTDDPPAPWPGRRRVPPRASSTHRSRRSARAISATARRIPGRRRRGGASLDWIMTGLRATDYGLMAQLKDGATEVAPYDCRTTTAVTTTAVPRLPYHDCRTQYVGPNFSSAIHGRGLLISPYDTPMPSISASKALTIICVDRAQAVLAQRLGERREADLRTGERSGDEIETGRDQPPPPRVSTTAGDGGDDSGDRAPRDARARPRGAAMPPSTRCRVAAA